jgi:hypothetical protein
MTDREEKSWNLTDPDDAPDKSHRAIQSPTTTGKTNSNSRGGSVNLPSASLSQNSRYPKSVFVGPETTPVSSPVFAGFIHSEEPAGGRRTGVSDFRERESGNFVNPEHDELFARLNEVKEFYNETSPQETVRILEAREIESSDDLHYYRFSQTNQVSPPIRVPSGTVPERFHAGRESLSVTRNVTIRESKRPKARSQDCAYRRRSLTSDQRLPIFPHESGGSSGGEIQIRISHFMGECLRHLRMFSPITFLITPIRPFGSTTERPLKWTMGSRTGKGEWPIALSPLVAGEMLRMVGSDKLRREDTQCLMGTSH